MKAVERCTPRGIPWLLTGTKSLPRCLCVSDRRQRPSFRRGEGGIQGGHTPVEWLAGIENFQETGGRAGARPRHPLPFSAESSYRPHG